MRHLLKTTLLVGMAIAVLYTPEANCQITARGRVVKAIREGNTHKVSKILAHDDVSNHLDQGILTLLFKGNIKTGKGFFNANTLLGEAVLAPISEENKIEIIKVLVGKALVKQNELMISKSGKKTYPLIALISNGELKAAELLIELGAMVHLKDASGETPLSSLLGLLKKLDSDSKLGLNPESKTSDMAERITNSFSWSLLSDTELNTQDLSDPEAYNMYSEYALDPIDACISGTWIETLAIILKSHMASNELVIETLRRAIASNRPKNLKAKTIETILIETNKRGLDLNKIMLNSVVSDEDPSLIVPKEETPLAMAVRLDDPASVDLLIQAGANIEEQTTTVAYSSNKGPVTEHISATKIGERYDSRKALKVIYKTPIKYEKVIRLLQEYNYGFDSTDLEEQVNAALSKMILLDEYRIEDKEMILLFGEENALGVRTGGIYNYFVENADSGNSWMYIALLGVLYYDKVEKEGIEMDKKISNLIISGFSKTGLCNIRSSLIIESLNSSNLIPEAYRGNMIRALDLIKDVKTTVTTPAY